MTSLVELLTEEGFKFNQRKPPQHSNHKPLRPKHKLSLETNEITPLPSHIKRVSSASEISNSKSLVSPDSRREGPPIDEVAIRAVISILSDYIGRYIKDDLFRKTIQDKCNSYLVRRRNGSGSYSDDDCEVLIKMKQCMANIDKLVSGQGTNNYKDLRLKSLKNSIELLTIVASLNSKTSSKEAAKTTCGIPNSHLSSCAQLYLAIVYMLQNSNRICARHLMQVFCDAPFLARTYLIPDLWERLFLPHLLYLKIWYTEELETLSASNECDVEMEKKMKYLRRVYDEKMDIGTIMFGLYYKQWLKVGATEPPFPVVPLPSRSSSN